MRPQSRQMLCNLAYKTISCCNSKKLPVILTTVRRNNHYSGILRSTWRSTIHASENSAKLYPYPTQSLCYRTTCIRGIKLKNDTRHKEGDKPSEKDDKPVGKLTFQYCLKYLYAWLLDRDVQFHIGRSFLEGTIGAFLYISDCLADKNYDGLAQVVAPKLLERIKNKGQLIRSDTSSLDVFIARDLKLITLVDMNWSIDRSTKIKWVWQTSIFPSVRLATVVLPFSHYDQASTL